MSWEPREQQLAIIVLCVTGYAAYRYDSSFSPALDWDARNPAREQGEELLKHILDAKNLEEAKAAASKLKSLSKSFLNWAGKAERLSFDVPTLPLFIHERLSTKAIIETLAGHKSDNRRICSPCSATRSIRSLIRF
jgi:hypothetical protein